MTNSNKTIETILRENVGKFCDYKTKNGEEGSGIIKMGETEVWVEYGHRGESAVDACDIVSVENIEAV